MAEKLTRAEEAFAKCMAVLGSHFSLRDVARHRLNAEYETARRAGFYQSAGVETSVKGEDWSSTPKGRAAIAAHAQP